ncbi:MAG TPA: nicotinamide riboside transporter PnuC [Abditibacteriaceae bacterium]
MTQELQHEPYQKPDAALPPGEIALAVCLSLVLIGIKWLNLAPFSWLETGAFISGGVCVWLIVRQNIWNWPIGIANSVIFAFVFWQSRLFADMGLQGVYVVLGVVGWYAWLHGGQQRQPLKVQRAPRWLLGVVVVAVVLGTILMKWHLTRMGGAAPLWDALTTSLSLAAQYLLTRKFLENWAFWILADLIYIPLYWSRGLMLTSVLYLVFLLLCVTGIQQWRRSMAER